MATAKHLDPLQSWSGCVVVPSQLLLLPPPPKCDRIVLEAVAVPLSHVAVKSVRYLVRQRAKTLRLFQVHVMVLCGSRNAVDCVACPLVQQQAT